MKLSAVMNPHDTFDDQGFSLLTRGQVADKCSRHGKTVKIDDRLAESSEVKTGINIIWPCLGGGDIKVFIAAGTHQAKAGQRFAAGRGKPCDHDTAWAIRPCPYAPCCQGIEVAGRLSTGLAEPVETLTHQHNITNTDDCRWINRRGDDIFGGTAKRGFQHLHIWHGGITDHRHRFMYRPSGIDQIGTDFRQVLDGHIHDDHLTAIGDALPVDSSRRQPVRSCRSGRSLPD